MLTIPLRLALDATSLIDAHTGVGRFTEALVARLARRDDVDVAAFAVTWRGRGRLRRALPAEVRAVGSPVPARLVRAAWLRVNVPSAEWLAGPCQVVHGPNFVVPPARRAAEVLTVHDLTSVRFPELCTADTLQYPALIARAVKRGAWVHAVSRFVADEVEDAFSVEPDRVVVVPNGLSVPPADAGTDRATGRHLAGAERYVLALGTVEPRKDLPTLVAAFDALAASDKDLHLVLAGQDGWGIEALTAARDRAVHRRRIHRLGWVSDTSARRCSAARPCSRIHRDMKVSGFRRSRPWRSARLSSRPPPARYPRLSAMPLASSRRWTSTHLRARWPTCSAMKTCGHRSWREVETGRPAMTGTPPPLAWSTCIGVRRRPAEARHWWVTPIGSDACTVSDFDGCEWRWPSRGSTSCCSRSGPTCRG